MNKGLRFIIASLCLFAAIGCYVFGAPVGGGNILDRRSYFGRCILGNAVSTKQQAIENNLQTLQRMPLGHKMALPRARATPTLLDHDGAVKH